jgi:hypothetical protein
MKGRIRIAAVGMVAMMVIGAMTSTAGAASATNSISANGGFISLSLLNTVGLTGGESSASASTGQPTTASGTGLCATVQESSNTCPTTTAANSADLLNTTANASESTAGQTNTANANCLIPTLNLVLVTASAACGNATAAEDANSNPVSTKGEGNLAQVTVALGSLPGLGSLNSVLNGGSLGSLCAAPTSLGTPSNTVPASSITDLPTTLLGTVNSLLGSLGVSQLSTLAAPTSSSPLAPVCSILSSLTAALGGTGLNGLLSLTPSSPLLSLTLGDSTSTLDTSHGSNGDTIQTATATTEGVDVNILGMLDVKVLPNQAQIALDTTTGQVQAPSATENYSDLLQVTATGQSPVNISLAPVEALITQLVQALGSTLSSIVAPSMQPISGVVTNVSADGRSGSATSADLNLSLLGGLVVLDLGDAHVAASSTAATPAVTTSAATVTPAAAAPAPVTAAATTPAPAATVPGVTTVHTGEFWAGTLPIILMAGMGLAGIMLIARRRIFSVARSLTPFTRRRGGH